MIAQSPIAASDPTSEDDLVAEAAEHMIARFGEHALTEVKRRIAELDEYGEASTSALWSRIHDAVELLQKKPAGSTH